MKIKMTVEDKELLASLIKPHPALYAKEHPQYKDFKFKRNLYCEVAKQFCATTKRKFTDEIVTLLREEWCVINDRYLRCLQESKRVSRAFDVLYHCSFLTEPSKLPEFVKQMKRTDQKKVGPRRNCCVCDARHDIFLMASMTMNREKRQVWMNDLGLSQEKIDSIEGLLAGHVGTFCICKAHFPEGSFKNGNRVLPNVQLLKLEETRNIDEVRAEMLRNGLGYELVTYENEVLKQHEQLWSWKAEKEKEEKSREMAEATRLCERKKRTLERQLQSIEDELDPVKRCRSCSPEKEDSQISLLLGSESWLDLVNALHPSTNKMNADELNQHHTMMSILTSNNIDPEHDKSSENNATLCASGLDLLQGETELQDVFNRRTDKNNSPNAPSKMEPFRGDA